MKASAPCLYPPHLSALFVPLVLPHRHNALLEEVVVAVWGGLRRRDNIVVTGPEVFHAAKGRDVFEIVQPTASGGRE